MSCSPPSATARSSAAIAGPAPSAARGRRVVDAPTRVIHGLLALGFTGAWLTAESDALHALHVTLGYTVALLLGLRLVYGLVGPRHARLSQWWRRLAGAPSWLRGVVATPAASGARPWRQGPNLLMATAVVAMLAMVAPLALSGYATHARLGGDALEDVHEFFAHAMLAMVLLHLSLLALLSVMRRQNPVRPMLTGRIPGPGPDLVRADRRPLAVLLLAAVLGIAAWQWQWQQTATQHGGAPAGHAARWHDDDD